MGTFQQVSAGSLSLFAFDSSCADKEPRPLGSRSDADLEIKKTDFVSIVRRTSSSQDLVKKTITSGTVQRKTMEDGGPLKNMMTAPIVGSGGEILGAIQIVNKKSLGDSQLKGFDRNDAKVLSVLCAHIASFIDIMSNYAD